MAPSILQSVMIVLLCGSASYAVPSGTLMRGVSPNGAITKEVMGSFDDSTTRLMRVTSNGAISRINPSEQAGQELTEEGANDMEPSPEDSTLSDPGYPEGEEAEEEEEKGSPESGSSPEDSRTSDQGYQEGEEEKGPYDSGSSPDDSTNSDPSEHGGEEPNDEGPNDIGSSPEDSTMSNPGYSEGEKEGPAGSASTPVDSTTSDPGYQTGGEAAANDIGSSSEDSTAGNPGRYEEGADEEGPNDGSETSPNITWPDWVPDWVDPLHPKKPPTMPRTYDEKQEFIIEACRHIVGATSGKIVCKMLEFPMDKVCDRLGERFIRKLCTDAVKKTRFGWESCMAEKSEYECKSCCVKKGKPGTNTLLCKGQCGKIWVRKGVR